MTDDKVYSYEQQLLDVPVRVGSRITLYEDCTVERVEGDDVGSRGEIMFEDYVAQYVPETGLLRFEDSGAGRAEFERMMDEAAGIEILNNPSVKSVDD